MIFFSDFQHREAKSLRTPVLYINTYNNLLYVWKSTFYTFITFFKAQWFK